jgi:lysophospholipase L1-like esterase
MLKFSFSFLLTSSLVVSAVEPVDLMPRVEDSTQMWWADGFPSHTPEARWLRVIQTGTFAFALNTETLTVPHFGAVAGLTDDWQKLPPADLGLSMTVDGKSYRATAGGEWSRWTGPRLVESGRFFQRGDVTDLVFTGDDGSRLNVDARFEAAAWSDRLGLILAARPGLKAIAAGEASFGRVRGGFGLDGTNHFEIAHHAELDPEVFTLELWVFVPADYQASKRAAPWLVCKNRNEVVDGNFGIIVSNRKLQARFNIGGGTENAVVLDSNRSVNIESWNHLAISYDGDTLRLYLNGASVGEKKIGRKRVPGRDGLAIGRRQDNSGDGYHFRGVVDEVRLYDRALSLVELRRHWNKPEELALKPVGEWTFSGEGKASMTKIPESWGQATMKISLGESKQQWDGKWDGREWREVALKALGNESSVVVTSERPVTYEASLGWHRINLDGIDPTPPAGVQNPTNDAIERVKFSLSNPADSEQIARLMFEKTSGGIRQRVGSSITGVSAILRDADGNPTGIPVQLSKNWHNEPEGGVYAGQWFHGISQVRLPAGAKVELELTLAYSHWGGVAAASHAQLCLIGWGSNQLWDQSAVGAWGESICYDPDQVQANCSITDVRPLMVRSVGRNEQWGWTSNVGGGDFLRLFNSAGNRIAHSTVRTTYHRQGPCLTEVNYAAHVSDGMTQSTTVSLGRTDDIVRGVYRLRVDVQKATDFSRFVIFQIGADTYSDTRERKFSLGNNAGLLKEWNAHWGGDAYRMAPMECSGDIPWISLHEAEFREGQKPGAWANRGIVIRSWKARLGGKDAAPWIAERGLTRHNYNTSTLDLVPPPGVTRFEPGDYIEATIEHVIIPQFAKDYYGPNAALRDALTKDENTWRMIHREAAGNERLVEMKTGTLDRSFPAVSIGTFNDAAEFTLTGGIGYVPITLTGLNSPSGYTLYLDDRAVNQSIHGNDFWQTDFDAATKSWSQTYNIPIDDTKPHTLRFKRTKARIVCFGDSITRRGYPALLNLGAANAGVAGHSSAAGLRRMQSDVLDLQPEVVVIFFGTNDARVDEPRVHVPVDKYEENINRMIDACEKIPAKAILCTVPPVDEKAYFQRHNTESFEAAGGIQNLLERYRQAVLRVAKTRKVPVVDLNQSLAKEPAWLSKDGVHPSEEGNRIIARLVGAAVAPLIR